MAEHKVTYREIARLKKAISDEQKQRDEWAAAIPELDALIAGGNADEEVKTMKVDTETTLAKLDATLAKLHEHLAELEATLPKKPEPATPKFDPEKHPLLKKNAESTEPAKPVVFNAGDLCEAQWTDRQWYKAKVQTVLGSTSDPKYHVRFVEYPDTLTVGREAIRPQYNEKKRKADAAPATAPAAPPVNSPHVISGPASINPNAVAANKEASAETNPPTNRRKIGGNKALERKEANWKSFMSKGPGKSFAKKESMFRSGTTVNSRVGFTGSGAGMTETHKRTRYNAKAEEDEDNQSQDKPREDDWRSHSRY